MAAPANVYLNNGAKLPVKVDGVVQYDSLIALKLTDYGSNIKTLFYVDGALVVDNEDGSTGFIGYVKIGSANYNHHASARRSKIIFENAIGEQFVLLNDAGLNTKGDVGAVSVATKTVWDFTVNSYNSVSAYYIDGTHGLEFSRDNGATWQAFNEQSQEENNNFNTLAFEFVGIMVGTTPYLTGTEQVKIRAYHTNTEDTTRSDITTVTVDLYNLGNLKYASLSSSASSASFIGYNIYTGGAQLADGIKHPAGKLYLTSAPADEGDTALSGYYIYNGWWYKFDGTKIVLKGLASAGNWPPGDSANYDSISFLSFSSSSHDNACTFSSPKTIYLSKTDGKYYVETTLTLLANGYYSEIGKIGSGGIKRLTRYIVNGVVVSSAYCPDGGGGGI